MIVVAILCHSLEKLALIGCAVSIAIGVATVDGSIGIAIGFTSRLQFAGIEQAITVAIEGSVLTDLTRVRDQILIAIRLAHIGDLVTIAIGHETCIDGA
jgi:hypothetical protein